MSNENDRPEAFYFLYRNNRRIQVSKEEWERSWLDWWNRTQREAERTES
jgi:hypothetical protein